MGGLKKDASHFVKILLREVNSIKTGAHTAKNQLVVTMNTLYLSLSTTVEILLPTFCTNVVNTQMYLPMKQ